MLKWRDDGAEADAGEGSQVEAAFSDASQSEFIIT